MGTTANATDKWSVSLRRAAERAAAEARGRRGVVEPGHLLIGLATTPGALAAELLARAKFKASDLDAYLGPAKADGQTAGEARFSPASQERIIRAAILAFQTKSYYIGTEHLLKAIIEQPGQTLLAFGQQHRWQPEVALEQLDMIFRNGAKLPELVETFTEDDAVAAPAPTDLPGALRSFGVHLTSPDYDRRLDPVIGRDREIDRLMQILVRRTKNNPLLLGDPGVGKTAIVEGLAKRIIHGQVPAALRRKKIVALDVGGLVAGTMFRGEFESRLKAIVEEARRNPDLVLFIDELHTIVGAGSASGSVDAANLLKPALARGELRCIGATTLEEYRQHIERDGALERRFQPITVAEPTPEESRRILTGLKPSYESHHGLRISPEAIEAAVTLSERYLTDRFLPDKAIDLIDEAAARVKIMTAPPPALDRLAELEQAEHLASERKQSAVGRAALEAACRWQQEERSLQERRERLEADLRAHPPAYPTVDRHHVAHVLGAWTNIPVEDAVAEETTVLQHLEDRLAERLVGQPHVTAAVAAAIRRSRLGIADRRRPLASFLCAGPTGVGKTTLARSIARVLFGDEQALLRLDMSEFSEGFTVAKLIGAPAGYVGYRESGLLTERVRRRPYQVILFDELDKAHRDVYQLLMEILDEGSLRDATGRLVNFRQTIIVATANPAGDDRLLLGFTGGRVAGAADADGERTREALRGRFPSELLDRFDATLCFSPLGPADLRRILNHELEQLNERLSPRGLTVTVPAPAAARLVSEAATSGRGARDLQRAIRTVVEGEIARQLLERTARAPRRFTLRRRAQRWVLTA